MLTRLLYVLLCLALPVAWGVVVNWIFDLISGTRRRDEPSSPEYQI
ncbi:hypothetical protein [Stratiformator vulcanicus]|uniref:Uncharacterized protein n=1 Tax=Stratiformator vulcanicus TaxID=2527980 RepID=A0A517R7L3_9PLAN|nr:hypothetical protein [Stratiformator vulcanicus]QDT39878.1 hypothetical protein Pan189_42900 [Stratiformator vulcanicus]